MPKVEIGYKFSQNNKKPLIEMTMTNSNNPHRGLWSGRLAFILAAAGSAVGLGNIWKFPYITGENGGGAFVLVYLVCIAVIGIPIMMSEVLLGRRGRLSPIKTMKVLAHSEGASPMWRGIGIMGVVAGIFILSYYSVIAGWALGYVTRAASGEFTGLDAGAIQSMFGGFVGDAEKLLGWHTLFMVMTMVVVARGVSKGLEKAVMTLMPGLFLILLILLGYVIINADFAAGLSFLFTPDFSKLNGAVILSAMGHAFFTLSLGMGAIMIYGSYLPDNVSIGKSVVTIAALDTIVALVAGMVIFPIVFANGLEPSSGPGLVFQTLPLAFGQMAAGQVIGTLFFVMLVFAAWSSSISIIEPAVGWAQEQFGVSRPVAALILGSGTWLLGVGTVLSFNLWSDVKILDKTFFDLLDYLTANIMLPLGGFLMAVFVAWVMKRQSSLDELQMTDGFVYRLWYFLLRFVTPVAVIFVFLKAIGIIS